MYGGYDFFMNEIAGFAITLLAILAATIFNNSRFSELNTRMDKMQADLSHFYMVLGRHDGKLEMLDKK